MISHKETPQVRTEVNHKVSKDPEVEKLQTPVKNQNSSTRRGRDFNSESFNPNLKARLDKMTFWRAVSKWKKPWRRSGDFVLLN